MLVITSRVAGVAVVVSFVLAARRVSARERLAHRPRSGTRRRRRLGALYDFIDGAELGMDALDALRVWLIAVGGGGVLWVATRSPLLGGVFVALFASGPLVTVAARRRVERRTRQALPELLESVAGDLRGGGTVAGAVATIGMSQSALAGDARGITQRVDLGGDLAEALRAWALGRELRGAVETAGALATAHDLGGAAASALEGLAASLRDREAVHSEIRAQSAQARTSAWVVGTSPLAYLAFLSVADREAFDYLLATSTGRLLLVAGLVLLALSAVSFRVLLGSVQR